MRPQGARIVVACFVASAAISIAHADDTHYATPLLGDRPTGMGSAATGVASEPSAAYYNPAGLTRMQKSSFAGGLWLRAFDHFEVDDVLRSGSSSTDFSENTNPGVPGFAAVAVPMGRRRADGQRPVVLALSTFQLWGIRRGDDLDVSTPVRDDSVSTQLSDRAALAGISLAFLLPRRLSLGLSTFLHRRRLRQDEDTTSFRFGADTVGPPFANATLAQGSYSLDVKAYHVLFRLGLHHMTSSRFWWGLMFQPPGIKLKSTADIRQLVSVNDAMVTPSAGSYTLVDQTGLPAYTSIPFEIRLGFAYHPSTRVLLAADVVVDGPIGNKELVKQPLPFVPAIGGTSLFIANSRERRPVANIALGTEVAAKKRLILRLGFYTDFSAAPNLPARSNQYFAPQINLYGFSGSIGFRSLGREGRPSGVNVGMVVSFGRGDAMAAVLDDPVNVYHRTGASQRTFYLTITGALKTAEVVVNSVGNRREAHRSNAETEPPASETETRSDETSPPPSHGEPAPTSR